MYREPLDGSEMVRVLKDGRLYLAPIGAVLDLATARALARLTARLDALDAALAAEGQARAAADTAAGSALAAETAARQGADTGLTARTAALEARPEEVVPFAGSLTTGLLAIGTKAFTVPLAGILASDRVVVAPAGALPVGLSIAGFRVVGDGAVEVTLSAVLALTASKTIPLAITALR